MLCQEIEVNQKKKGLAKKYTFNFLKKRFSQ